MTNWLVNFVNLNEDLAILIAQLEEAYEIENEIFNQHVKMDIMNPLMKYYIQNFLKQFLQGIINPSCFLTSYVNDLTNFF